jgi:hypothetical protein
LIKKSSYNRIHTLAFVGRAQKLENKFGNYSPDFKIVAAISSLNELILDDLFLAIP